MLPATGVTGADVDAVKFTQVFRGYKTSEVDWVLDRLGLELDALRAEVDALRAEPDAVRAAPARPGRARPGRVPGDHRRPASV